jgi:hypothetical protein
MIRYSRTRHPNQEVTGAFRLGHHPSAKVTSRASQLINTDLMAPAADPRVPLELQGVCACVACVVGSTGKPVFPYADGVLCAWCHPIHMCVPLCWTCARVPAVCTSGSVSKKSSGICSQRTAVGQCLTLGLLRSPVCWDNKWLRQHFCCQHLSIMSAGTCA